MRLREKFRQIKVELGNDRFILYCLYSSTALAAAAWLLTLIKLIPLAWKKEPLMLHYSVLVGIDRIGPWYWTLVWPALSAVCLVANTMIMISLWRRRAPEIAKLVSVFTLCLSAIFLINTILLVLLNVGV
jgi:hypothetical protein